MIGDDPLLALRDGDANARIQLSQTAQRSALLFVDAGERQRAALGVAGDGPLLHLAGGQGHVSLGVQPGVLELRDANGTAQAELTIGADGLPRFELYDRSGAKAASEPGPATR
jgi:hypothetical protein